MATTEVEREAWPPSEDTNPRRASPPSKDTKSLGADRVTNRRDITIMAVNQNILWTLGVTMEAWLILEDRNPPVLGGDTIIREERNQIITTMVTETDTTDREESRENTEVEEVEEVPTIPGERRRNISNK